MRIRPATADDAGFLAAMVNEAAHWNPAVETPPVEVAMQSPGTAHYVTEWPRPGDGGVVAVDDDGTPIGAAWWRQFTADDPAYGYVDDETPEVAIAVVAGRRGGGIGEGLLRALHDAARQAGLRRLSLSVQRANFAMQLYERVGYVEVGGDDHSATMVVELD